MAEGYDFSAARPGGAWIRSQGRTFVVRYLWSPESGGLSNSEIADYARNGVAIAVVMEQGTGDATLGYAKGVAHAVLAQSRLNALELADDLPIYFAVDEDVSWSAVAEYFRGVNSVMGNRAGIYGSARVIRGAMGSGLLSWFWQTYAWSGGDVVDGIHLMQYRNGQASPGGPVDFCRSYQANYGQLPVGSGTQPPDRQRLLLLL